VVIGPLYSDSTLAVGDYLARKDVINLPYSSAYYPSNFQFYTHGTSKGNSVSPAYFAYEDLGARTGAIIVQDFVLGYAQRDGLTEVFEGELGGEIIYNYLNFWGGVDFAPVMTSLITKDPDVIFVMIMPPSTGVFIKQYREFGLDIPVIWVQADVVQGNRLQPYADDALGMYANYHWVPANTNPENIRWMEDWEARYGEKPGANNLQGLRGMQAYLSALEYTGGNSDFDTMVDAMINMPPVEIPTGMMDFNEDRVAKGPTYYIVQATDEPGSPSGLKYWLKVIKEYPNVIPRYMD
jgi:branched-chain amino acid transport system substrate-binding protein